MALDTPILTYSNDYLIPSRPTGDEQTKVGPLVPSATYAKGQILGQNSTTKKYGVYASGNSDGTQTPVGVLARACITDSGGNISYADAAGADFNNTDAVAMFYVGDVYFRCEDLTGLDANAVTKLGRLISGTVTTGEVHVF